MTQIVSASTLDQSARLSVASLIVQSFSEFYKTLSIDDALLRATLAAEINESGTELEFTKVLWSEADGPIGIMAAYPADEMSDRQRAGMFHLLSALDPEDADRLLDAVASHATEVGPVPEGSFYLARLAIDRRHRGSGGAGLLLGVLREAAEGRPISLHVHADNARALAFYRREGFAVLAPDGYDYLCMSGE